MSPGAAHQRPSAMQTEAMAAPPATVSVDHLRAARTPAASHGKTAPTLGGDEHAADVVPADELDRLRETIDVLSDTEAVRALADAEPVVVGRDAIRFLVAKGQG